MAKAKRERPRPYSFENEPPDFGAARARFDSKQETRINLRMQLAFKKAADFADQTAYDDWYRKATYALYCMDEEIQFLAVWMSLSED